MKFRLSHTLHSFLFLAGLVFSGCAVLEPVGNAVTQGYENFVAYFNVYYNAQKIFREAEDEALAAQLAQRGKASTTAPLPATAKTKFNQVIDKCSNILTFHTTSNVVDDALFLIGKSYYYQAEYVKAARKFMELLSEFPESPLAPESQLWYARTLEKQGSLDEAFASAEAAVRLAREHGDDETIYYGLRLLGAIEVGRKEVPKAVEYFTQAAEISDDEDRSEALVGLGDVLFDQEQYEKAIQVYLRVPELTSDPFSVFYAKHRAAMAARRMKSFGAASDIVAEMMEDFRLKDYTAELYLERGLIRAAEDRWPEAVEDFERVDTTYARSDAGTKAAYELAKMYEGREGDYRQALTYYTKVSSTPGHSLTPEGKRKFTAFTKYFDLHKQLIRLDSVLNIPPPLEEPDSITVAPHDSVQNRASKAARVVINPDSIRNLIAGAMHEMGDLFFVDLATPDSAVHWYTKALRLTPSHSGNARVNYILATIAVEYPDKGYGSAENYLRNVVEESPNSRYADQARKQLGMDPEAAKTDPAAEQYQKAEILFDTPAPLQAVQILKGIVEEFPESPYAAQSEFALAWLYQFRLQMPDSAVSQYTRVTKKYANSPYAHLAQRRIGEIEIPKPDTSRGMPLSPREGDIPQHPEEKLNDQSRDDAP